MTHFHRGQAFCQIPWFNGHRSFTRAPCRFHYTDIAANSLPLWIHKHFFHIHKSFLRRELMISLISNHFWLKLLYSLQAAFLHRVCSFSALSLSPEFLYLNNRLPRWKSECELRWMNRKCCLNMLIYCIKSETYSAAAAVWSAKKTISENLKITFFVVLETLASNHSAHIHAHIWTCKSPICVSEHECLFLNQGQNNNYLLD